MRVTPDAGELGGQDRLDPRRRHERHRGEVVDLVGLAVAQHVDERALVEQVAGVQRDRVADVLEALEGLGRGAPDHAVDLVALLEQELGEVGAVLAGDAGDQCARRHHVRVRQPRLLLAQPVHGPGEALAQRRPAPPSRAARAPSRRMASGAGRRPRSVGRCSSSNAAGSSPHASQIMRAISATVSSSEAEMLKSSFSAGRVGHRGDDALGDVVDVGERARLLARAEDLERPLA